MYTGIIQGTEKVISVIPRNGFKTLTLSNNKEFFTDAFVGASVSINGICLTLTSVDDIYVTFDISDKTSLLTTMKVMKAGDEVNVERSHKPSNENGGHSLYGHIGGIATVLCVEQRGGTATMRLELPEEIVRYFFDKGFIGMHGASLTVHSVDRINNQLSVNLIPETLRLTNLGQLSPGDNVNIEVDHMTRVMVDVISSTMVNGGL
ncbi:riboflavin synthase subunit alpha [Serratia ureilytica]|uniref:riboflavin synthase subunit alpha n=1 Tax=Serratia ureilytica TaxID=300181 RepID=UPI00313DB68B